MAGFGGAVKLTGESEYRKALSQITQSLRVVSAEMKATSTSFANGDKSTQDLATDSQDLTNQLEKEKNAIATLKTQLATMQSAYEKTSKNHQLLIEKYETEKNKLEEIKKNLGVSSQEYKAQQKVVDDLAKEVTDSTRAYDAQGKSLNDLRIKTANAETTANKTAKAIDELGKETEEAGKQAEKGGQGFTIFKGVVADLASTAIKNALNGIKQLGGAMVDLGKQAVDGYAQMEQLEGGVKKIFGEDLAKEVTANAQNAFKTAGMSANEYMETVTGFSATLIQGLGEDTAKSAEYADMAIRNMSDNANTFGTDISSIQNAYQGFAKGNFTMLDNLKLGYSGTQAEMARLINESGVLGDSMKVTAKTVKDVPFYKMIEAIDKTQERMGIMGTTSKEASGTIQGSTGAMKSAWQNMLVGMADENANFKQLATNFVGTLITEDGKGGVLGTIIPRVSQVITGISSTIQTLLPQVIGLVVPLIQENLPIILEAVSGAIATIMDVLPQIMPIISDLIPQIVSTLVGLLPQIIEAGIQIIVSLIQGITDAIPDLMEMIPDVIDSIITTLTDNLDLIIDAGIDLLMALTDGIMDAIPKLVQKLPKIITSIVNTLLDNLPKIVDTGVKLLTALTDNMPTIIDEICDALPTLISGLIEGITSHIPEIVGAGVTLFTALVQNQPKIILEIGKSIPKIIKSIVDGILDGVPDMADAGFNLIKGLWEGIDNAVDWLLEKIEGFKDDVLDGIKEFFGIASPSKLMRDEVGKFLAEGIGVGFENEMKNVTRDMENAIPTSFDVDTAVNGVYGANNYSGAFNYDSMVSAFKDALAQVKIELDSEVAGAFVDKTVTRLVYTRR